MEPSSVVYSMLGAAASAVVSYGVYRAASREASRENSPAREQNDFNTD
jgi:hypothetical protein